VIPFISEIFPKSTFQESNLEIRGFTRLKAWKTAGQALA
jgi:hypothetical protein